MDIDRLIDRHKNAVYRQMVRTCGNRDDAEDALADALLAALKASDQLKDPTNFQAWLSRIGTRACGRMRVRERLTKTASLAELQAKGFEFPDDRQNTADAAEMAELKSCVRGAVDSLPALYREVYIRREILGDRAEDVATSLDLSVAAVKTRLHRAREMVREALDSGLGCRTLVD